MDEGSLVSVHILSLVLKLLCEHAQLAKLIILGKCKFSIILCLIMHNIQCIRAPNESFINLRMSHCSVHGYFYFLRSDEIDSCPIISMKVSIYPLSV